MKKAVEIASSMVLMGRGWKVLCNFAKQRLFLHCKTESKDECFMDSLLIVEDDIAFIHPIAHFLESPRTGRFLRKGENVSGKD